MKRLIAFLASALLLTACASRQVISSDVAGFYTMVRGGFNESLSLNLKKDSSYTMQHELISCTDLSIAHNEETGAGGWKATY